MNKMLVALALILSIFLVSCAPLEEKVVAPMKVVVAQVGGSEGPSQSEFTALKLKVDRLERELDRAIENVDSVSYAKANHRHQVDSGVRSHSHDDYLLKVNALNRRDYAANYHEHNQYLKSSGYSLGGSDYAAKYHEHSQYLSSVSFGGSNYADRHHTHDYAKSSHSHGGGFGGW